MLFSAKVDGKLVMRAYTPTSSDNDIGYFDLVIKIYFAGVNIQFPEGGKMSQHLGKMKVRYIVFTFDFSIEHHLQNFYSMLGVFNVLSFCINFGLNYCYLRRNELMIGNLYYYN
jgi:hypothetical protein